MSFIGETGPTGATGSTGLYGLRGYRGPIGPTGNIGEQGVTGANGIEGDIGDIGNLGDTGPIGITGIDGVQGDVGITGDTGYNGDIGIIGPDGIEGLFGDIGIIGDTGPIGEAGYNGIDGLQGIVGDAGETGPIGENGLAGNIGIKGYNGAIGGTEETILNTIYLSKYQSSLVLNKDLYINLPQNTINICINDITNAYYEYSKYDKGLVSSYFSGVSALGFDSNNNLYATGAFIFNGDFTQQLYRVAKWNGSSWDNLGNGLSYEGYTMTFDSNNNLYVGGSFKNPGKGVAKWDGSSWSALGNGVNNVVYKVMLDSNNNLYVGGNFTEAGDVSANNIAKWDGSSWSALGNGVVLNDGTGATVRDMAFDSNGNLYVVGNFTQAGDVSAFNIAKWDGSSWSQYAPGFTSADGNTILSMKFDSNNNLYIGGSFKYIGDLEVNYIAKWNGSTWTTLGSGMSKSYFIPAGGVGALAFDSAGNLYAGGDFERAGGVLVRYIAKWNGVSWSNLGSGVTGPLVQTIVFDSSDNIIIGGGFVYADGNRVNNIAKISKSGDSINLFVNGKRLYNNLNKNSSIAVNVYNNNTAYTTGLLK